MVTSTWGKEATVHLACMDVYKAFDHLTVQEAVSCMERRGHHPSMCVAVARELEDNQCEAIFEGVKTEELVDFDKFIRTGGKEGTVLWNYSAQDVLAPLAEKWTEEGKGIPMLRIGEGSKKLVNHMLWADNYFLLANRKAEQAIASSKWT